MFVFQLCFLETPILRFALLPYLRRISRFHHGCLFWYLWKIDVAQYIFEDFGVLFSRHFWKSENIHGRTITKYFQYHTCTFNVALQPVITFSKSTMETWEYFVKSTLWRHQNDIITVNFEQISLVMVFPLTLNK